MSIPESIVQTYQVVPTQDMGEALWQSVESARGFLSPPKIVVIFITGRIAAYYAEAKQQERTTQSDGFRAAASGLLFTSDITSRGLDYPGVTAVIQLGAPESRAEYVHRVGRTGRREREGLGILLLHDFEESWMAQLDGLGLKQSPPLNVKAQAYYSRINHAMRHPEDLDVLEVFRDAFRFAGSIGALDVEGRPPSLTEQNAQRYGVADISDPAVHIVKEAIQPKVSIAYQLMSAAQIHKVIGPLLDGALQKHSKVVIHFIHGDIAKYYADFLKGRPLEAFEAHSSVSKKVRKKILQSFESAARVNDKVVLKAYLAWLRYYGLHPLVTDKQPIIQEAQHFFAAATGDGEVPSLTQRMVHCFLPLNIAVCCFDFSGSGMSGGEHVSLGFFERDDLAAVIQNLRERRGYTRVGVWGRSMGATTAVLHSARDPSLAGVVADSPFSDLWKLMQEIVNNKLRLPSAMFRPVFEGIRLAIQQQASFDICEVSPLKHLESCFLPIFLMHGEAERVSSLCFDELLRNGWQGEATRVTMPNTEHNDHREEKFLARAALFMVRALRWESFLDTMALEALTKGLLPTTTNISNVQSKMNGSATLAAAQHFEQLALSSEIRKMAMSRDVSERQHGLVLAAAELSGAYKGAEKLDLSSTGTLRMTLPASFKGTVCFGKDDIEVAFGWVGGTLPSLGHIVQFAVLSANALSISRVILKPLKGGGFSTTGIEQLCMEAVELPLNKPGRSDVSNGSFQIRTHLQ
eukprot:g32416.t1